MFFASYEVKIKNSPKLCELDQENAIERIDEVNTNR